MKTKIAILITMLAASVQAVIMINPDTAQHNLPCTVIRNGVTTNITIRVPQQSVFNYGGIVAYDSVGAGVPHGDNDEAFGCTAIMEWDTGLVPPRWYYLGAESVKPSASVVNGSEAGFVMCAGVFIMWSIKKGLNPSLENL